MPKASAQQSEIFPLYSVNRLAALLGCSAEKLGDIAERASELCHEHQVIARKTRTVVFSRGELRRIQSRLFRLLRGRLAPLPHSYGGVQRRTLRDHVLAHSESQFAFTADISNFYPSIHSEKVLRLFSGQFGWSRRVALLCTKISTHKYHLPIGFCTSPLIADRMLQAVDRRIDGACHEISQTCSLGRVVYTRWVDDITISGPFDLSCSGIPKLIARIMRDHGFSLNHDKTESGRLDEGLTITGIRCKRAGKLDVSRHYIEQLEQAINDAKSLSLNGPYSGEFQTPASLRGKVNYVSWINPGRKRALLKRLNTINWKDYQRNALRRGIVA